FVGGRGYSVGSHIKDFRKYGGLWKAIKHSRQATILITNEHNTSQTCVYCFRKTTHSVQVSDKKSSRFMEQLFAPTLVACS
ncbi:hypothetical protein BDF21DRAFT_470864, partial [Thamnidium elegans]